MRKSIMVCFLCFSASAASAQEWAGPYVGGGLGYDGFSAEDLTYGPGPFDVSGAAVTGFGGYNLQSGKWVYGPEVQLGVSNASGEDGEYQLPFKAGFRGEIRARVGYDAGPYLPYLALGYVSQSVSSNHEGDGLAIDDAKTSASGLGVALGIDYRLAPKKFLRIEYQHVAYQDFGLTYHTDDTHDMTLSGDRLFVGFGMQF